MAHVVTENNYESLVSLSAETVLLDIWAPWCVPCRIIDPIVDDVALTMGVSLAKLNVEEAPDLASRIGVGSLPTIRLIKGGQVIFESVGTLDRAKLVAAVAAA